MDFNTTNLLSKGVTEGIIAGFLYDVFSIALAFILVKIIYDKFFMNWKWGGWKIKVFNSKDDAFENVERVLLPKKAKEIMQDEGEFSIYVKGVVASTNTWLNTDISSKKAIEIGLVKKDIEKKEILIDVSKNPKKKEQVKFTKETQEQIDRILLLLEVEEKETICTSSSPTTSPMTNAEEL